MGQTPNYSLATFQSQDITQRFLEYRTAVAGDEASSNMYKIDLAMKGLSDQIEALSKRGTIAQINAEYSDVGYFTATSESISDYTNGMVISLSLNQTNQGTVGLNINEIGTVQIVYATPEGQLQDITAGMMKQNSVYFCVYNGTYWVLSSAGYASTSNNVSDTINGKNITDIFETDGTTAKNATLQKQTEKLRTPVSIGLSGVTATAQQFDGSQGITIPITQIPGQLVTDVVMSVNSIEPQSGNIELQATDVNAVATVNGISPSDGNVQLSASDIGAAPSSNGISTYTCTTTGTTHALVGTGNNIKFVADAEYKDGDIITINGLQVTAQTQDGAAISDGAWANGATVVCWLDGTTLTVGGGGKSQSYAFGLTAVDLSNYSDGIPYTTPVDGIAKLTCGASYGIAVVCKNLPPTDDTTNYIIAGQGTSTFKVRLACFVPAGAQIYMQATSGSVTTGDGAWFFPLLAQ